MSRRKEAEKSKKTSPRRRRLTVPYVMEKSNIFGDVTRPRVDIQVYSIFLSSWISIEGVLADTGADISVLPKSLGVLLVGDFRQGRKFRITGLVAGAAKYIYLHRLMVKLGHKRFKAEFAIASTDDVPPTLGRVGALDRLNIEYRKGKELAITW